MARTRLQQAQMSLVKNLQNNTTNTTQDGVIIQTGWGFELGTGTTFTPSETITFPQAYTSRPIVLLSAIGFKDSSDPSHQGDFSLWEVVTYNLAAISTTGFSVRAGAGGNTISSSRRVGYAWIAIGV
jgi:hypothetical protein